jgi:rod shape-determining protein MreB
LIPGAGLETSIIDHGPDVAGALMDAVARLNAAKAMRPPNEPFENYQIPDPDLLASFMLRLTNANRRILVYEASSIREALVLPDLGAEPARQEHLAIYEQIAEMRASLQTVCDKAVVAGYGRVGVLTVPRSEVQEELRTITAAIETATKEIRKAARPGFGGVAVNLGPVAVDLKSVDALLSRLLAHLRKDRDEVDALAIWSTTEELERMALQLKVRLDTVGWSIGDASAAFISRLAALLVQIADAGRLVMIKATTRLGLLPPGNPLGARVRARKVPRFDLAIDLGTSETRIWVRGRGVVLTEPTIVAVRRTAQGNKLHAVGAEAHKMVGRTPGNIVTIWPVRGGGVADLECAQQMLKYFVQRALDRRFVGSPRALVTVQGRGPEVHTRAAVETCSGAGLRRASAVERCLAAALGAELPIGKDQPCMIVEVGAGTTEIAVFAEHAVVASGIVLSGGNDFDGAVHNLLKHEYGLLTNVDAAEATKRKATDPTNGAGFTVMGRDIMQGVPRQVMVRPEKVFDATSSVSARIAAGVRSVLETVPQQLREQILGIALTGGASQTPSLAPAVAATCRRECVVVEDPATAAIRGCGRLLEEQGLDVIWSMRRTA